MSEKFLSNNSPYTFVWHDGAGQSLPIHSDALQVTVKSDGLQINILDNAIVNEPIILINSAASTNQSRNNITIGNNAQVQIIEYLMSDDADSNNNVNTNINCLPGSNLKYCMLQQARNTVNILQQSITKICQQANSQVAANIFSFGGNTSRMQLLIELNGQHASCEASSLAYTNDTETQAVLLKVDHMQPNCSSKSLARSILKDKSITDFVGRITVHPNASKSSADLQIKNLLCSPKAQAFNKPELEIYNDDVRCSHGSSTGQLDANALFYMRSRGIDIEQATEMLIAGFIAPVIDNCSIPKIAEFVKSIIAER